MRERDMPFRIATHISQEYPCPTRLFRALRASERAHPRALAPGTPVLSLPDMRFDKLTIKSQEALQAAQGEASKHGHSA